MKEDETFLSETSQWAICSKDLAFQHCQRKREAFSIYKSKGLFSYTNLVDYLRVASALDKAYALQHFSEWEKLMNSAKRREYEIYRRYRQALDLGQESGQAKQAG